MPDVDLAPMSEAELLALRGRITVELERRQTLAAAPALIEQAAAQYRAAAGVRDGTEYRAPTGAHDAVEPGGKRVFQGHLWENTSGAFLAHSPSEYPAGWADLGPADATTPVPAEHPAWAAGVAYKVGDVVSYQGVVYRVVQAHTSAAHWLPDQVASLYTRV